ncbi:MAG TPA: GntR family transcriptional regulator [Citreicella sp.]|jgi:DNA-binding GntR family transcriptional regulator|uniref:DNA-binding transcriptional regulator, GntR family n=1 Tax=Salipiger marinus TaxID=555512 RepID=A0A1G8QSD2_9RHOB|nr:DNA-binding transcriptional regulator, GntR family [Salipiger marinus]HBM60289.1 GntR family transcriptional regulator [Citreicella sp.]HBT02921.1 GntR family transcriptional regulator [Citreicella sp.]
MGGKLSTKSEESRGPVPERLATELRGDILGGRLQPGARLGEVALAERFEVSRGPVRAALNLLSETGLVTIVPNSGARVRVMSRADARALYEVRAALESEAAMLAAAKAEAGTARRFRVLLDQHAQEVGAHPQGAYLQGAGDRDFHMVTAQMAANPIILRYLTRELYPQLSLLRVKHRNVTGRGAKALREHERIAAAIADGDSEVAGLLMRRHIRNSWIALEAQLSEAEKDTE